MENVEIFNTKLISIDFKENFLKKNKNPLYKLNFNPKFTESEIVIVDCKTKLSNISTKRILIYMI